MRPMHGLMNHGCVKRSDILWDFGYDIGSADIRRNVHSYRFIARQRPPAIVWFITLENGIVGDDFIHHHFYPGLIFIYSCSLFLFFFFHNSNVHNGMLLESSERYNQQNVYQLGKTDCDFPNRFK